MANHPPFCCPICNALPPQWKPTGIQQGGLSAGKAVAGGLLAGPVGAIVGASMGKKQSTYYCESCGWSQTYNC